MGEVPRRVHGRYDALHKLDSLSVYRRGLCRWPDRFINGAGACTIYYILFYFKLLKNKYI